MSQSCLGFPEEEKSRGSKARSHQVGPEGSATTLQPVWDSWDFDQADLFSLAEQEAVGGPEKGVGGRFPSPLLGQFREEQVSTAPLLKETGRGPAPVGPESLASQRNCPGEESVSAPEASQVAQW